MSLATETKEQRLKLQGQPFTKKLSYFFYYYWIHTLLTAFVLTLLTWFFVSMATKKDSILSVDLLNCDSIVSTELLASDYLNYLGEDSSKKELTLDAFTFIDFSNSDENTAITQQKLTAQVLSGTLDIAFGNKQIMEYLYNTNCIADLSAYVPQDFIDNGYPLLEIKDNSGNTIAIAFDLSESMRVKEYGFYSDSEVYATILPSSSAPENAQTFIEFLYDDNDIKED